MLKNFIKLLIVVGIIGAVAWFGIPFLKQKHAEVEAQNQTPAITTIKLADNKPVIRPAQTDEFNSKKSENDKKTEKKVSKVVESKTPEKKPNAFVAKKGWRYPNTKADENAIIKPSTQIMGDFAIVCGRTEPNSKISIGQIVKCEAIVPKSGKTYLRGRVIGGAANLRALVLTNDVVQYEGAYQSVDKDLLLQLRKFYAITAGINILTTDLQRKLTVNNPHSKELAEIKDTIKNLDKMRARQKELVKMRKDTKLTSAKRMANEDELREISHKIFTSEKDYKVVSERYKEWEKKHPIDRTQTSWESNNRVKDLVKKWQELNQGIETLIVPEAGAINLERRVPDLSKVK